MIEIDRYRESDQAELDALHARVIGERAEALRKRWRWLYFDNPATAGGPVPIWVAREDGVAIGQMGTLPVRLCVNGAEIDAAWGSDFMVDPAQQRRGVGEQLATAWEGQSGAALALSLTDASYGFFTKRRWPGVQRVPRFAKPLTQRVLTAWNRPDRRRAALALPLQRAVARWRPRSGAVRRVTHFDDAFTRLWTRVAPRFAFAVRRDATYLEWKYVRAPHLRYSIAALTHGDDVRAFIVYRHVDEPNWRSTVLVDYLADPDDTGALVPLLRWLDRESLEAGADMIRTLAPHEGFQRTLQSAGYLAGRPTMRMTVRITGAPVPPDFYESNRRWHVTQGDSDVDR